MCECVGVEFILGVFRGGIFHMSYRVHLKLMCAPRCGKSLGFCLVSPSTCERKGTVSLQACPYEYVRKRTQTYVPGAVLRG